MDRKFSFSIDEFYHIYNRGTDKRDIFLNQSDYQRFIRLLFLANSTKSVDIRALDPDTIFEVDRGEPLISIGAWCLMPNHFHLLVRFPEESLVEDGPRPKNGVDTNISLFMKKLLTGYSMYFNKKYHRRGPLFESRFKAQHVDDDIYLKYLFAYIHLNPVKIKDSEGWGGKKIKDQKQAENFLGGYRFSSYLDYMGGSRSEAVILDKDNFPEYFDSKHTFKEFIDEWLNWDLGGE